LFEKGAQKMPVKLPTESNFTNSFGANAEQQQQQQHFLTVSMTFFFVK